MEHQLSQQLQTSARDQGFRLMSALIGAASSEKKMDRTTKGDLGDNQCPAGKPTQIKDGCIGTLGDKIKIVLIKFNSVQKATHLKQNQKWKYMKWSSNCHYSYRPVIKAFVQLSVQVVQKKMEWPLYTPISGTFARFQGLLPSEYHSLPNGELKSLPRSKCPTELFPKVGKFAVMKRKWKSGRKGRNKPYETDGVSNSSQNRNKAST